MLPLDGPALRDSRRPERRLAAALAMGRDAADVEEAARRAALRLSGSMGRRGGRGLEWMTAALLHAALDPLRLVG